MRAKKKQVLEGVVELKRLEPVLIEIEKEGVIEPHLVVFEITCNIGSSGKELIMNGDIQETIYELHEKDFNGLF